ncbi:WYL domain protein [compost metagenome]
MDFDLQRYIDSGAMQFGIPRQIKLHAWVTDNLARLLNETPLSPDMKLVDEAEGATLTATVNDTWELKWWALSHAGSIQVREPSELRSELRERLAAGLELHENA